jgi:hypothetical protein
MDTPTPDQPEPLEPITEAKPSFWLKLGGGSLSISILVHAVLLIIGVVWIYQVIPTTEDEAGFSSGRSVNGGDGMVGNKTLARLPSLTPRVAALNASSKIALPEPQSMAITASVGALGNNGLSSGLGNGRGGPGNAFGFVETPGIGLKPGPQMEFGIPGLYADALVGVFYDTKQDPNGKDTGMNQSKILEVISEFTARGWNERLLSRHYYRAPQKLAQTRIYMPMISADAAPKAFGCDDAVQGRCWIALYRGSVIAPKTGKFRFVGAADDLIVVRFNKRNQFEHGYFHGTTGMRIAEIIPVLEGKTENREIEKQLRSSPMRPPISFYSYDTTQSYKGIGGLAVGPEFEVVAGTAYPIEILISEIPGGLFGAVLMLQESGVAYEKASSGAPILPIFRTSDSNPPVDAKDNAPPYEPRGPVWRVSASVAPSLD